MSSKEWTGVSLQRLPILYSAFGNPKLIFSPTYTVLSMFCKLLKGVSANSVYAASSSCFMEYLSNYPTPETALVRPQYPYAWPSVLEKNWSWSGPRSVSCWGFRLCLFNVYGPRSRTSVTYGFAVFGVFLAQRLVGKPFAVVGDGHQTRDFPYVTDVAKAVRAAAQSTETGRIYNVRSGATVSINRLVELLGGEKSTDF